MSNSPDNLTELVTLRDGTSALLRPIRPDDAPRLRALHSRLSPESRYFRFFSARAELPETEAKQLAAVDYKITMAVVAELDEKIIGVARYGVADSHEPTAADAAIVVEDAYQGRGLGTRLMAKLIAHARTVGIVYLIAHVDSMNLTMLKLIQRANLPTDMKLQSNVWKIRVQIS